MMVVIVNPVSGHRQAPGVVQQRLGDNNIIITTHRGHAAQIVLDSLGDNPVLDVVLASGDGTLHEIIDAVPADCSNIIRFVIIPCGTANALYSSLFPDDSEDKFRSLASFLANKAPIPLTLASTTFHPSDKKPTSSCIVVSTALHASILRDSEALRASHPGIERFKIAAEQNSRKWYNARVKLDSPAQIYDPVQQAFVDHDALELDGPFGYFLSTVNVDRLEPAFLIAPLARSLPPSQPLYDLVILRPFRDPSIQADTPEAREAYVAKIWNVLGSAYKKGAHVRLRYSPAGDVVEDGDGPLVIEYFRCTGWEWIPAQDDPDAHFVCCDGDIIQIPSGGYAQSSLHPAGDKIQVYA